MIFIVYLLNNVVLLLVCFLFQKVSCSLGFAYFMSVTSCFSGHPGFALSGVLFFTQSDLSFKQHFVSVHCMESKPH